MSRTRRDLGLAALAALLTAALPARAVVARLDDSTSPRAQVGIDSGTARAVDGMLIDLPFGRIDYRLATAPHAGRRARIFYVIPAGIAGLRSPAGLQLRWRSSGIFASGTGRPGERVPVWNGVVQTPWMNESFDLTLRLDPREVRLPTGGALSFESTFEIETLS